MACGPLVFIRGCGVGEGGKGVGVISEPCYNRLCYKEEIVYHYTEF